MTLSGLPDYTEATQIYGDVTIAGTVTISGSVTVTNTVTVQGTVSISGTVTVQGTVSISGTVAVSGTVTVSGSVSISGTVAVSGSVSITGTVTISGSVTITGTVTISIGGQTVNVSILAPSARMVSVGGMIGSGAVNKYAILDANTLNLVISLDGRGRLDSFAFYAYGDDTADDLGRSLLCIYVDGVQNWAPNIYDLDAIFNGGDITNQMTATGTAYRPSNVNPKAALTYVKTTSGSATKMNVIGGYVNVPFEYATSLAIYVRTYAGDSGHVDMIANYGAYQ